MSEHKTRKWTYKPVRFRDRLGWHRLNPVNQPQNYTQIGAKRFEKGIVWVYTEPVSLHFTIERRDNILLVYLPNTKPKPDVGFQVTGHPEVLRPRARSHHSVEIGRIHA